MKRKVIRHRYQEKTEVQPERKVYAARNVNKNLSLNDALDVFVTAKKAEGLRERTIAEYYRHIAYLIEFIGRDIPLSELSSDLIRRYANYLLNEKLTYDKDERRKSKRIGLSPHTVNIRLRTLKTMCRFWYAEGYSDNNPMATVKPVKTDQVAEVQGLTDQQIGVLLNNYDETSYAEWRDKTLVYLLLDTGLRINEAVTLTIDQIDFRRNMLNIPSERTKNRRYREVPVSLEVVQRLLELNQESQEYFGYSERIFTNAFGEEYTADSFRKRLNRVKHKLGMDTLHPHQFRHTFAKEYLLSGGDLFTLQKILDHADIKTTRKYIQMDTDHIRSQHLNYTPIRKYMRKVKRNFPS